MPHLYKQLTPKQSVLYAWFPVMHTRVDLILCDQAEKDLVDTVVRIEKEWKQLEKTGNFYDTESELYNINQTAVHSPVSISSDLYDMIGMCLRYHPETRGCFDITIRSDGYNRNTIAGVELSPETISLHYRQAGMRIDLSGFLKGYALEKARKILSDNGVINALLNMGNSSVMALGNHPHGEGWKVAFASGTNTLRLHNQCLTISGNDTAERKHIMAPQTGEWVTQTGGIAVVTENATEGEIFSTALFAATPEQQKGILRLPAIKETYNI